MFLIRQARPSDLETLLKLAKTVHFTNLPADKEAIAERIRWSQLCFRGLSRALEWVDPSRNGLRAHGVGGPGGKSPHYMFVIEDASGLPVGTSAVIAEMGSEGNPNVALQLFRREKFSTDLHTGVTHVTARVIFEENGPTEIGGLILTPTFRGAKLGRFLSFIRFHFIALHRPRFKERLLAEMMAPISAEGYNAFWEYFGRRFINLSYVEADLFCQRSREFMLSLLPREEIYLTLLPPDARNVIGKVANETVPARRLLEKIGFEYKDRVDPFDGGPHLQAQTDQIPLVRDTRRAELLGPAPAAKLKRYGIVSAENHQDAEDPFRAVAVEYAEAGEGVRISAEAMERLRVKPGAMVGVTPMDVPLEREAAAAKAEAPGASRARGGASRKPAPKRGSRVSS